MPDAPAGTSGTGTSGVGGADRAALAADIAVAASMLDGVVRRTPVLASRALSDRVGGPVWVKCENLQLAGSFKIRGAYVRISRLSAQQRAAGVVAASAGNHAQGVALAGQLLGTPVTVFMPVGAALPKVDATRGYGAQVRLLGVTLDESIEAARRYADDSGRVFLHPFDHSDVIAGQGTVGLEILEQCPDVATIVVGTGGGGLLAGIATAVAQLRPDVTVVGVQAAGAAAFPPSLDAGRPVPLERVATMADGIAVGRPGDLTLPLVADLVDRVVTVSEEALSRALLLLLERGKLLVEPAGAAAVAAVAEQPLDFRPPVVAVLSGGNVDPVLLLRVIRHGLTAAGRYLSLRARIPDRPGGLAALLSALAGAGANVLTVEHVRTEPALRLDEVEVALRVETRGADHGHQLLDELRAGGFSITDA